jgi:hypothetical protein
LPLLLCHCHIHCLVAPISVPCHSHLVVLHHPSLSPLCSLTIAAVLLLSQPCPLSK